MKLPTVYQLISKHHVVPKKRLGQHFLTETPTIKKIVDSLHLTSSDVVLEIGHGMGVMTAMLAETAEKVFAVDTDTSLAKVAKEEFGHFANIEWILDNILKIDPVRLAAGIGGKLKIVGNLPYNISSPILFWLLDNREYIESAVIMIQKEVADRLISKPDCRDYGILSVLVQTFARCEKLFDISPKNFIPPPKVWSSVVKIGFKEEPIAGLDEIYFRKLVRAAFGKRRKMLVNSILGSRELGIERKKLTDALVKCGIDSSRRAETLSIEEFISLSNALTTQVFRLKAEG